MLWAIFSTLAFLAPAILYFIIQYMFRGIVLDINTKKKVIDSLSTFSVGLVCIAVILEACVTLSHGDLHNPFNDPCPELNGLRKVVFQKVTERNLMLVVMVLRATNFLAAWFMVVLQIIDKKKRKMPVGPALYVSVFASYVILGGTCVELYSVGACNLSLRTVVHTILSVLSTFGSILSSHLDLVGEVDQTHESALKLKEDKIKRLHIRIKIRNAKTKRHNAKIKRLETEVSNYQNRQTMAILMIVDMKKQKDQKVDEIAKLKSNLNQKDDKIKGLDSRIAELERNQVAITKQKDYEIGKLKSTISEYESELLEDDEKITQLRSHVDTKDEEITQLNSQMDMKDYQITELNSQVVMKDNMITELNSQVVMKDTLVAQLNSQVAVKDTMITELQVVVKDTLITRVKSQVDTKDEEITRLKSLVDTKDEEIHRLETKNGELKSMVSVSEREQLAKDEKVARLITLATNLEAVANGLEALVVNTMIDFEREIANLEAVIIGLEAFATGITDLS